MQAEANGDPTRAIRWIRISCWCGATIDLLAVVALLFPGMGARAYGLTEFHPSPEFTYAAETAAALMLGWTALLLWVARRPLDRKGVLVLTVCPVIAGSVLGEIAAVRGGFLALANVAPTFVVQFALTVMFLYSYALARIPTRGAALQAQIPE